MTDMVNDSRMSLTPKEVVQELDRFIVGQKAAKKAVAIALRNRWRRQRVEKKLQDEILPKNIIMIGPTGSGKTEIARRLAKLAQAPFIKIEATKFTEVGYVGRDVDSMVRDLVECSVKMCREMAVVKVQKQAAELAEERLLDILLPRNSSSSSPASINPEARNDMQENQDQSRLKMKEMLKNGHLNDKMVSVEVSYNAPMPAMHLFGHASGMEDMANQIQDALSGALGKNRNKQRKMKVSEALEVLKNQEASKLVDQEQIQRDGVWLAEQSGIIFLDEVDKIAKAESSRSGGPDVSREGVQRDILPIVEGSSVSTKYGSVKTDHVLFIAAGAFHVSKPSDLIPELQGRFPIRVELESLGKDDFVRILTEPENSLVKQYKALLATENLSLEFDDSGIEALAQVAEQANSKQENIGARRLYTVLEKLLEEESFTASETPGSKVLINEALVNERLGSIVKDEDLSKYIL